MATFTFSAHGFRWRVRPIVREPLPVAESTTATVTGLYFECDDADPRFLPFTAELLPTADQLAEFGSDDLSRFLSWAERVQPGS